MLSFFSYFVREDKTKKVITKKNSFTKPDGYKNINATHYK